MTRAELKKSWDVIKDFRLFDGSTLELDKDNIKVVSKALNFLIDADFGKHWDCIKAFKNGNKVYLEGENKGNWYLDTDPEFLSDQEYKVGYMLEYEPETFQDIELMTTEVTRCGGAIKEYSIHEEDAQFLVGKTVTKDGENYLITYSNQKEVSLAGDTCNTAIKSLLKNYELL